MIERQIIIGLITSTEYCLKIKDIWDVKLIESATAKRLATWAWEYFNKYDEAPGKNIEGIFYKKIKNPKFPKDIAEEIEQDVLPSLSEEYENKAFNLEYLLEETEKHFNERHIQLLTDNIQALLANGEREEAEKMVKEFRPLGLAVGKLNDFIVTANQIRNKRKPKPIMLMKPWLREGQGTIIYGGFGSGKSLLAILIGYLLGVRNYDDKECEIGQWQVKNQTGCLYLDGELGEQEMEERLHQFEWIGNQPPEYRMRILSIPDYQLETEDSFPLADRKNQQKIIQWLREHPTYKLIVLDSVTTLFGLVDENSNAEWNTKINPLLRDLRALGVAYLLLHHSGKDSKKGLRGASAMGAMAHNIFRLVDRKEDADKGEAWFEIKKDKQRAGGFSFKAFSLHYIQNKDQTETHWKVEKNINQI